MDFPELQDKLSRSVQGTEALDNRQRAIRAYRALEGFAGAEVESEPVDQVLTDLLVDILHLVDEAGDGISFPEVWQRAVRHHNAETTELRDRLFQEAVARSREVDFEDVSYRCPECDTYSGSFTSSGDDALVHSICGREGSIASFVRGTPEYEEAYEGSED